MTEMATHSLDSAERHAENELLGITQWVRRRWVIQVRPGFWANPTGISPPPPAAHLVDSVAAVTVIWDLPNRSNGPFDIDEGGYFGIVAVGAALDAAVAVPPARGEPRSVSVDPGRHDRRKFSKMGR